MALSDRLPEIRGRLTELTGIDSQAAPLFVYADSGRLYEGWPVTIKLTDPIELYDEYGQRLEIVNAAPTGTNPADFLIEPKRE